MKPTKAEKREKKKDNKRKMKVSGGDVRKILKIIVNKKYNR